MHDQRSQPKLAKSPISLDSWPKDLCLLRPENRAFIEGKSKNIKSDPLAWSCFTVLLSATLTFGAIMFIKFGADDLFTKNFLILAVVFVMALAVLVVPQKIWSWKRNRYLEHNGILIVGKVVHSQGTWVSSEQSISVTYTFISPQGNQLSGEASYWGGRSYKRDKSLESGRPVAVLYADDSAFQML